MLLMLDTNICIYAMNKVPGADRILRRISGRPYGEIILSSITASELAFGVEHSSDKHRAANLDNLHEWLELFTVLDYPASAMSEYAKLRSSLIQKGLKPGAYDVLIAAHAIHIEATLITNDADFSGLPNLKAVNWLTD